MSQAADLHRGKRKVPERAGGGGHAPEKEEKNRFQRISEKNSSHGEKERFHQKNSRVLIPACRGEGIRGKEKVKGNKR